MMDHIDLRVGLNVLVGVNWTGACPEVNTRCSFQFLNKMANLEEFLLLKLLGPDLAHLCACCKSVPHYWLAPEVGQCSPKLQSSDCGTSSSKPFPATCCCGASSRAPDCLSPFHPL